ncbi:hypothetical protein LCGC14_1150130 [marine sediment metagenome]|uniref:Uncharacterized protein n=1 Tax=marine sediment metagenome TaxID=412755 RepID=A0A0F9PDV9_9ZZZZ
MRLDTVYPFPAHGGWRATAKLGQYWYAACSRWRWLAIAKSFPGVVFYALKHRA